MAVSRLAITNLRNLGAVDISPSPQVNVICGPNGSGKTSLLESVYLLGRARSFVTSKHTSLVQRGQKFCAVYGQIKKHVDAATVSVGVTRASGGKQQIKIAGDRIASSALLAELLPLQIINPGAFKLLDGGPKSRRQFVDWGVFHVEHSFIDNWKRVNRCLKQRNNLLRQGVNDTQLMQTWDREFVECSSLLTEQREQYVERLKPVFMKLMAQVSDLGSVSIEFHPGWDGGRDLSGVLKETLGRDRKDGYTHFGPQRAEVKVRYLGLNAAETLSRGQQKLVVCAMKIAQGHLYQESKGRPCVYLIDDLAAELDVDHRASLCTLLGELECQLFVTSVDKDIFRNFWLDKEVKMFHVKHGSVEV